MLIEVIEKLLKDKSTVSNTNYYNITNFVVFISKAVTEEYLLSDYF